MSVKVSVDEMCNRMDVHLPHDVPWATVKQVAEWIGIDHMANANVMGTLFGRIFGTSADISYRGSKVRAWLVRNPDPLTHREWTNAEIRAQLDSNAALLANRPTRPL